MPHGVRVAEVEGIGQGGLRHPLSIMDKSGLVERLMAFPTLAELPRGELEWLVEQGKLERHAAGAMINRKGTRLDRLIIVLAGGIPIHRDLGAGPRRVMEWRPGDVTGRLPYSRMTESRVDVRVDEDSEWLAVHETLFPEMVGKCPGCT